MGRPTVTVTMLHRVPREPITTLAIASGYPNFGLIRWDADICALASRGEQPVGAVLMHVVPPETLRIRNLLLDGSAVVRIGILAGLIEAISAWAREHGYRRAVTNLRGPEPWLPVMRRLVRSVGMTEFRPGLWGYDDG